ncbi:MAG: Fic family protein [Fodinibius sp.]|nr:Fic family protein [Fodinibius sp.]
MSSPEFLCWIHDRFYELVPENFKRLKAPSTGKYFLMKPGQLRDQPVEVGNHLAPHPESLKAFMDRFNKKFNPDNLHGTQKLIAIASSHHRLAWIHPFTDGNGRVAQTIYSRLPEKGPDRITWIMDYFPWPCQRSETYKNMLARADSSRKGDYDGRGNLSGESIKGILLLFPKNLLRSN